MYAYAPDGTKIVSTKETVPGTCDVNDDSYSIVDGRLDFDHGGGTDMDWDAQKTVEVRGEQMFLDEEEGEWPACALVLVPNEIDPDADEESDRALPAEAVAAAEAAYDAWEASAPLVLTVPAPADGWPDASTLTDAERALLSPIAATLVLLSGGGAARMAADPALVEAMLPQAMALARIDGATIAALANAPAMFPSKDVPLPTLVKGQEVVDLANGSGVALVELTDVVWDDDGAAPDLPTSMIAAVGADWDDDNGIVDMLSDTFGFCVSGIGDTTEVDRAGAPVDFS